MVKFGSNNRYQEEKCSIEIGLRGQNIIPILDSIVNITFTRLLGCASWDHARRMHNSPSIYGIPHLGGALELCIVEFQQASIIYHNVLGGTTFYRKRSSSSCLIMLHDLIGGTCIAYLLSTRIF